MRDLAKRAKAVRSWIFHSGNWAFDYLYVTMPGQLLRLQDQSCRFITNVTSSIAMRTDWTAN